GLRPARSCRDHWRTSHVARIRVPDRAASVRRRPGPSCGPGLAYRDGTPRWRLVVHPAAAGHRGSLVLLRKVRDERLRGEDHRRNRGTVLQRGAGHLRRVDDAGLHEIDDLVLDHVVAPGAGLRLGLLAADALEQDPAVLA